MIRCHDLKYMIPKHISMRYVLRERVPYDLKCHQYGTVLNASTNRFKKKLSGNGMLVRKHIGKNRTCLRRIRHKSGYIHLDSFIEKKMIRVSDLKSCESKGAILRMETSEFGMITIEFSKITDCMAIRNVFCM